jgi:hypothetical protein
VKRIIEPDSEGLTIEVSEISGQQEQLLNEFQACREGRCCCPTGEYEKLDSLEIAAQAGKITLRLKAKPEQLLDSNEIDKCLENTKRKLDPNR